MMKSLLAEKMKKKGKRDEKIQFFRSLAEEDSSYSNILAGLLRM